MSFVRVFALGVLFAAGMAHAETSTGTLLGDAKAGEAKKQAEEAMKNAKNNIDFAKAQGEFAALAAQIAALRKFRGK